VGFGEHAPRLVAAAEPWLPIPWRVTLPMFALTFCFSFCRPAGNNLILEQVDRDTGAASSLMVFF
jgi:hypothetical protein